MYRYTGCSLADSPTLSHLGAVAVHTVSIYQASRKRKLQTGRNNSIRMVACPWPPPRTSPPSFWILGARGIAIVRGLTEVAIAPRTALSLRPLLQSQVKHSSDSRENCCQRRSRRGRFEHFLRGKAETLRTTGTASGATFRCLPWPIVSRADRDTLAGVTPPEAFPQVQATCDESDG